MHPVAARVVERHAPGAAGQARRQLRRQVAGRAGDEPRSGGRHGFSPVMSASSLKNPFFRSLLVVQLTGTLW